MFHVLVNIKDLSVNKGLARDFKEMYNICGNWNLCMIYVGTGENKAITAPRIQIRDSHEPESLYDICGNWGKDAISAPVIQNQH